MTQSRQYSVIVTYDADEDVYNASVPALGIVTDGFTAECVRDGRRGYQPAC